MAKTPRGKAFRLSNKNPARVRFMVDPPWMSGKSGLVSIVVVSDTRNRGIVPSEPEIRRALARHGYTETKQAWFKWE